MGKSVLNMGFGNRYKTPLIGSAMVSGLMLAALVACSGTEATSPDADADADAAAPSPDATALDAAAPDGDASGERNERDARVETFTLGGKVRGLRGAGLRLRVNEGEVVDIGVDDDSYSFPTALESGTRYVVAVAANPADPWQTCTVANASGTVADDHVDDIDVSCEDATFVVSGTVSGLTADGLELMNTPTGGGAPEKLSVTANATSFAFTRPVRTGESYVVTLSAKPPGFECGVANGEGTIAGADVTDVAVSCRQMVFDFGFTGAEQVFVVPDDKTSIDVMLQGAQGGTNDPRILNYGGVLSATLAVTPGESLALFVGGQPADESGGYNGGGAGDDGGRGGGGATDIRRGGTTLAHRILVAGGGGGGGLWRNTEIWGGYGGGLRGANGLGGGDLGGRGGTQSGSGTGLCMVPDTDIVSGSLGIGGTTVGKNCGCQGYGGGGGYYGGAASGNCRGGGGGSGYAAASDDITNVLHEVGWRPGHGRIRIDLH